MNVIDAEEIRTAWKRLFGVRPIDRRRAGLRLFRRRQSQSGLSPGTGTLKIGGRTTGGASLVRALKGPNVVGGDVVEVAPQYDNHQSAQAGAEMFFHIFSLIISSRRDRQVPRDPNKVRGTHRRERASATLTSSFARQRGTMMELRPDQRLEQPSVERARELGPLVAAQRTRSNAEPKLTLQVLSALHEGARSACSCRRR